MTTYTQRTDGWLTDGLRSIPPDPANIDYARALAEIAAGASQIVVPTPTFAAKQAAFIAAIQSLLDTAARGHGYDDILSAVSYASDDLTLPFAAEGTAFKAWRARVWAASYAILAAVQGGERAEPTIDQVIAELPQLVLP